MQSKIHELLCFSRQITAEFLPLLLLNFVTDFSQQKKIIIGVRDRLSCLKLLQQVIQLLFELVSVAGFYFRQLVLLVAENILTEGAAQLFDTFLGEKSLLTF